MPTFVLQISDSSISKAAISHFFEIVSQSFDHRDNSDICSIPTFEIMCCSKDELWSLAEKIFGSTLGVSIEEEKFVVFDGQGNRTELSESPFPYLNPPKK